MKAFVVACVVAIIIAAVGAFALDSVQQAADQAFVSPYARVGA